MSNPISPPPVTSGGRGDLPAYVSNGLIGLRVLDVPLLPGIAMVNGYTGLHPQAQIEAAAPAPYPLAGDIGLDNVWLTSSPQQAAFVEQSYDFSNGELTTIFTFTADGVEARVEVLTFCSRKQPTIVVQEVAVRVNRTCDLVLRAIVHTGRIHGRMIQRTVDPADAREDGIAGALAWESLGGEATVGAALATEFLGDSSAEARPVDWGLESDIATEVRLRARPERSYRLRAITSLVPSKLHSDPDREAIRLVGKAAADGFDTLREENRLEWQELWRGRVLITADDDRWQRLADAAFYYLNSSVHVSAPASTSIFGLAQWSDYHYYYGHVMWDIEFFDVPALMLLQPDAARSLLEYRLTVLDSARENAKLKGRRGIQFPWESGPLLGEEAAPGSGKASWYEDHVSPDVAWAFALFAHATGDGRFLSQATARILYGVADWIASRVARNGRGFEFRQSMGIAERVRWSVDDAFTVMGARRVLTEAIACAEQLGEFVQPAWREVLSGLTLPVHSRTGAIMSHRDYRPTEEKGATPGPLAALFPMWYELDERTTRATLDYYLRLAPKYVGSAMLSPLYGTWAAWAGDRALSARLLDDGYAKLVADRFMQTLEQSPTMFPDTPKAGPFFANIGGFLMGLLFGLPGIRVGPGEPHTWPVRKVILPEGWRSIEVERAWIRMQPARIYAEHGAERAMIDMPSARRPAPGGVSATSTPPGTVCL